MLSFALSLLVALPASAAEAPRNPGVYVHLGTRKWLTLDPSSAFDAISFIIAANVYEPLIGFKTVRDCESFEPFLSATVPTADNGGISKDGLSYRFTLREGVKFHDGSVLSAEDARYSLLRFMLTDAPGGPAALLLGPVLGVTSTRNDKGEIVAGDEAFDAVTVDGKDLVVKLKRPNAVFLKLIASLPIIVSKKHAASVGEWDGEKATWRAFNGRPVDKSAYHAAANGTGAFSIDKEQKDPEALTLTRHDGYWRAPAKIERILLKNVPPKSMRIWMLENGDADAAYFEASDFNLFDDIDGVKRVEGPPSATPGEVVYFTFNADPASSSLGSGKLDGQGIPPDFFADRDVREGFSYAFDRQLYLKEGLAGRGIVATGPIPPLLLHKEPKASRGYDLKKAEKAFRRAFGGKLWETGFTATLTYSTSNPNRIVVGRLLRTALKAINPKFQLRIQPTSSGDLYARAEKHELPIFISGYYADYPDPHSYAFGMLHSGGYYPKAQRYSNPEMDKLIDEASQISDRDQRMKLYDAVLKLYDKDLPLLVTAHPQPFTATRDWISGFEDEQNIANLRLNNFPYFYALSKN